MLIEKVYAVIEKQINKLGEYAQLSNGTSLQGLWVGGGLHSMILQLRRQWSSIKLLFIGHVRRYNGNCKRNERECKTCGPTFQAAVSK